MNYLRPGAMTNLTAFTGEQQRLGLDGDGVQH